MGTIEEKIFMSLSREKRLYPKVFKEYFDLGLDQLYPLSKSIDAKSFFNNTLFRPHFDSRIFASADDKKIFNDKFGSLDFVAETYNSYKEIKDRTGRWFIKPYAGTCGDGIVITDMLDKIIMNDKRGDCLHCKENIQKYVLNDCVYQRLIENPLLLNNRKQDIRVWIIIETYNGYFNTYLYYDGWCKISINEYKNDDLSRDTQLTNAVNALRKMGYEKLQDYTWPWSTKSTESTQYKIFYEKVIPPLKQFSELFYLLLNNKTQRNQFHLFALDFLPDEDMKLWLLDVNANPGPGFYNDVDPLSDGNLRAAPEFVREFQTKHINSILREIVPKYLGQSGKLDRPWWNYQKIFSKKMDYTKWIEKV